MYFEIEFYKTSSRMHQIASHDVYFLKIFWGSMPPDSPRRHVQNGLTNQNWLAPGLPLQAVNCSRHNYSGTPAQPVLLCTQIFIHIQ